MVKLAEKKILADQRQAISQSTASMAETLAMELLHKPGSILSKQEVARIYEESECKEVITQPTVDCDSHDATFFRTQDGSCNNRQFPTRGAANTQLRRLIPPHYDDGICRARGFLQSQGSSLFGGPFAAPNPSPRVASTGIIEDRDENDTMHTHILMQWGQFMDHDMDAIPEFEGECDEGCEVSEEMEGQCYPFAVPEDDEEVQVTRASPSERGCHGFRRSIPACPEEGEHVPINVVLPREQLNAITHYIDGSMVYGHTDQILEDELRDQDNRDLLKVGPPASDGKSSSHIVTTVLLQCSIAQIQRDLCYQILVQTPSHYVQLSLALLTALLQETSGLMSSQLSPSCTPSGSGSTTVLLPESERKTQDSLRTWYSK